MSQPPNLTSIVVQLDGNMQNSERTGNWYIFQTDNLTRFLSCLIMGAAVSYPEAYEQMIIEGCNEELCAALNECLADAFAELNVKLDTITASTSLISQVLDEVKDLDDLIYDISDLVKQDNTVLQPKPLDTKPYSGGACDGEYAAAGAAAVSELMNRTIVDVFQQSEAAGYNDAMELADIIFSAVPGLETLPVDELYAVVNWFFEEYEADYNAAYDFSFQLGVACDLACKVVANNCIIDHIVLQQWFDWVGGAYTSNKAGQIFSRFGTAAKQGLLAQIQQGLNALNGGESLSAFYDRLIGAYSLAARQPNPFVWDECGCVAPTQWTVDPNACLTVAAGLGTISVDMDWVEIVGTDLGNGYIVGSARRGGEVFTVHEYVPFGTLGTEAFGRNPDGSCFDIYPNPVTPKQMTSFSFRRRKNAATNYAGFRIRVS